MFHGLLYKPSRYSIPSVKMCERIVVLLMVALCLFSHALAQDHEDGEVDDAELQEERRRLEALAAELEEQRRLEEGQGDGAIPGQPEQDYPVFSRVPQTSFSCADKHVPGYYADIEARCQAFHICGAGGTKHSFLCPGGSVFNQKYLVCDWWYGFLCEEAPHLFEDQRKLARFYQQEQNILPAEETFVDEPDHNYIYPHGDIFHSAETGVPNRDRLADLGENKNQQIATEQKNNEHESSNQQESSPRQPKESLLNENKNYRFEKRKLDKHSRKSKFDDRTDQKDQFSNDNGFITSTTENI